MLSLLQDTMLGGLPDGWNVFRLRDALSMHMPGDWGDESGPSMVNVLRSTNLTNYGPLDFSDVARRSIRPDWLPYFELKQGDILLERSGGGPDQPVGRVGFVEEDLPGFAFSNFLHLLRPNPREVSPRFLGWLLHFVNRTGRIIRLEQQTTQMRNLNFRDYMTMPLPRPPEPEQAAIARVLDVAEVAVARARESVAAARHVKRSLTQTLFHRGLRRHNGAATQSPIGPLPSTWKAVAVDSVIEEAQYGLSMPMHARGCYPILRMAAIQDGRVQLDDLKYVDLPDGLAAQYLLRRGDVLFNRTNSAELVGKVGVFRADTPAVFASYLIRLCHRPDLIDSYFLGQQMASHAVQSRIRRYATPGVQQVNINATNLKRTLIALPCGPTSLDEQREIADVLERQDRETDALIARVELLERLKRGLLYDLLTGRVRLKSGAGRVERAIASIESAASRGVLEGAR